MSKKLEICSATYNITFNQDANDVFRTGCAHLYHFLHVNGNHGGSAENKPMMFKVHLEISELIEETEEQNSNSKNAERPFVQQLEAKFQHFKDSLQANNIDAVNKLMERMDKLEKNLSNNIVDKTTDVVNNTIDHETNKALLSISDNATKQSVQQLDKKVKALKDRIERLEMNKFDIGQQQKNQQNSFPQKPSNNENNGSDYHSDGKEYQMTPKENQDIHLDKGHLVSIWFIESSDSSLETAIHNVIEFAKKMHLTLTRDQIKHIDVRLMNQDGLAYYVFFRTRTIKEAFLMKRDILRKSPYDLTIWNESGYNRLYIRNFKSSDFSKNNAIANVIGLAKQIGLTLLRDQIKCIDVFIANQTCLVCRVEFYTTQVKNEFLKKSHILKQFPKTKSLEIY